MGSGSEVSVDHVHIAKAGGSAEKSIGPIAQLSKGEKQDQMKRVITSTAVAASAA
jgi:hypothetical protein